MRVLEIEAVSVEGSHYANIPTQVLAYAWTPRVFLHNLPRSNHCSPHPTRQRTGSLSARSRRQSQHGQLRLPFMNPRRVHVT